MQYLLARAKWDAGGVRDDTRGYVTGHLGDPGAVLVTGETGDAKKGTATPGGSGTPRSPSTWIRRAGQARPHRP